MLDTVFEVSYYDAVKVCERILLCFHVEFAGCELRKLTLEVQQPTNHMKPCQSLPQSLCCNLQVHPFLGIFVSRT